MSTNNSQNLTIAEVAKLLNVTTVRVHGLVAAKKLTVSNEPKQVGTRFVTTVTGESIAALVKDRENRSQTNGSRQYVVSLDDGQLAELKQLGYDLKPRFQKKA